MALSIPLDTEVFCYYCLSSSIAAINFEIMVDQCILLLLLNVLAHVNTEILSPPKLVPFVNERTQSANTNFQILCSVLEGSQPLFFEWSKNGQPIKSGPNVKYRIENSEIFSTLIIKSVDRIDSGNYSCLVKNAVGSDSRNILLIIKGWCDFNKLILTQCSRIAIRNQLVAQ